MLHIEREVKCGLLLIGLGVYYHLLVVGHAVVGALWRIGWYCVGTEEILDFSFNVVDIDVANNYDAL